MLMSVFAYGSNLDLKELEKWLSSHGYPPRAVAHAEAGVLFGHRLVWHYYSKGRAGGAASVEPHSVSSVCGAVLDVSRRGLDAIDHKEGVPRVYQRRPVWVQLVCCAWKQAWVYQVTEEFRRPHFVAPTSDYRQRLLDGGSAFALPAAHLAKLAALPVNGR